MNGKKVSHDSCAHVYNDFRQKVACFHISCEVSEYDDYENMKQDQAKFYRKQVTSECTQ